MKVALVKPPAIQNAFRGGGVYVQGLTKALEKIPGVKITDTNPDIIHYLYFDPFFLTLTPNRSKKTIVTVFDLTPIVLKRVFPRGIRGEIKWQIQKRRLKSVDAIITISKSAKNDIEKIIGISDQKVFVTYLAAGDNYKNLNYQRENFVLYVGDVNPNKNINTLLNAMTLLPEYKLVLVGKAFLEPNLSEAIAIKKQIKDLELENRVTLTGFVSEEEKIALLNKAKVYVQPSIYEGFGLPVLEAMACGTPVICGRNSSLVEIAGDAATYANIEDSADLADKISKIKITGKEISQAKKFSWEKTAAETFNVYEKILASH